MSISVASLLQGVVDDIASIDPKWLAITVGSISLSSIKVNLGGAFVAVPGVVRDGREYIDSCDGVNVIFAHADSCELTSRLSANGVPVICVPRLAKKISVLASNFYNNPSKLQNVIGITGTNGKTTCAHFLSQIISLCSDRCGHIGTLGCSQFINGEAQGFQQTGMTTPSPIDVQSLLASFAKDSKFVAMEVSSHGLAQSRVSGVFFKGAIFTNLSRDHLDFHSSFDDYFEAKAKLFFEYDLDFAVINIDDSWGEKIAERLASSKVRVYGVTQNKVRSPLNMKIQKVVVDNFHMNESGLSANLISPWGQASINTGLFGEYNAINIALVAASACALGLSWSDVIKAANALNAVPGRLQKVEAENVSGCPVVFVDFAHTPDALTNVLTQIKTLCNGQLWVVVGCGGDRDKGKRSLMAQAAVENADQCVFTSDNPRDEDQNSIFNDMTQTLSLASYRLIENRKQAIEFVIEQACAKDIIVVAGKGHEKHQVIKGEKIPFDDVLVAGAALNSRPVSPEVLAI